MFIKKIENGKKIATLGPLIHNRQVIEDLASKGVYACDSIEDIPSDHTVVIRRTECRKIFMTR